MPSHDLQRNDNIALLTITLTEQENQTALEKEAETASKNLTIPGFRAGKAPLDVVLEHVNEAELREKALLNAVQEALPALIKETGLELIIPPTIKEVKDGAVTIECTEKPAVTLKKLKLKDLPSLDAAVKDEDLERAIEGQLQPHTTFTPVDRAAKKGDQVICNLTGKDESGKDLEGFKEVNYRVVLGKNVLLPGLEDAMVGKKTGETTTADVTLPNEHEREDLRGKTVTFELQVAGVNEVSVPELDDNFVKANFNEDSVQAFKDNLKARLVQQEQTYLLDKRRDAFLEMVREGTTVKISENMRGFRAREVFQNFTSDLERSGMTFEDWLKKHNKTQDDAAKELEKAAEDQWITQFGLQHLLAENEVKVEDADIDARLDLLTSLIDPKMAPQLKEMYQKDQNMMSGLQWKVEVDKLIDALTA